MISIIEPQALSLPFILAGQGGIDARSKQGNGDGWVHHKTVPYTIIAQATEGRYGIVTAEGNREELLPGEAFLTPPDMPLTITHHCNPASGIMRMRWVHFNFLLYGTVNLSRLVSLPLRVPRTWADRFGALSAELHIIENEAEDDTMLKAARIKAEGYELLVLLLGFLKENGREPALRPGLYRLLPVLNRIDASLGDSLSVEELAATASLSVPHFYAEFKKEMGTSPHAYLMGQRLARVCNLLRAGTLALEEISIATGFNSSYHLSREFKKKYGIPPGQFRKRFAGRMMV